MTVDGPISRSRVVAASGAFFLSVCFALIRPAWREVEVLSL